MTLLSLITDFWSVLLTMGATLYLAARNKHLRERVQ